MGTGSSCESENSRYFNWCTPSAAERKTGNPYGDQIDYCNSNNCLESDMKESDRGRSDSGGSTSSSPGKGELHQRKGDSNSKSFWDAVSKGKTAIASKLKKKKEGSPRIPPFTTVTENPPPPPPPPKRISLLESRGILKEVPKSMGELIIVALLRRDNSSFSRIVRIHLLALAFFILLLWCTGLAVTICVSGISFFYFGCFDGVSRSTVLLKKLKSLWKKEKAKEPEEKPLIVSPEKPLKVDTVEKKQETPECWLIIKNYKFGLRYKMNFDVDGHLDLDNPITARWFSVKDPLFQQSPDVTPERTAASYFIVEGEGKPSKQNVWNFKFGETRDRADMEFVLNMVEGKGLYMVVPLVRDKNAQVTDKDNEPPIVGKDAPISPEPLGPRPPKSEYLKLEDYMGGGTMPFILKWLNKDGSLRSIFKKDVISHIWIDIDYVFGVPNLLSLKVTVYSFGKVLWKQEGII